MNFKKFLIIVMACLSFVLVGPLFWLVLDKHLAPEFVATKIWIPVMFFLFNGIILGYFRALFKKWPWEFNSFKELNKLNVIKK